MEDPKLKNGGKHDLVGLVKAARKKDESALHALIVETQSRLFRFLYLLGADNALAHDLCQDTYLYVFEHLKDLKEPAAFVRWIFRIAKNKFLDHRKSPRNADTLPVETLDSLEAGFTGEARELIHLVRQTLTRLEEEERLILILIDMGGHSHHEAAEIIGISEAAATSRLRRAREAFHRIYFSDDRIRPAESPLDQRGNTKWETKRTSG